MGKSQRDKGNRTERTVADMHKALGVDAQRVPLSGAVDGFKGDVRIHHNGRELRAEVKARGSGQGFVTLERWLSGNDLLFLKRDRQEPLVVLTWETYAALLNGELSPGEHDGRPPEHSPTGE